MKNKKYIAILLIISSLVLAGCTKGADYNSYHKEVNNLYEKIVTTDAKLNNIDVDSENAVNDLFLSLDALKVSFEEFSKITPPEEFKDCQFLSENTAKYLSISEDKFHEAFDGEYNDASFQEGISNYNNMIQCINYMGNVLEQKDTIQN